MIILYRRFPFLQRQTPSKALLFCLFFHPPIVPLVVSLGRPPCRSQAPPLSCAGRPYAGRGLHPRPERSTHAKAGQQQTENKNQLKDPLRGNAGRPCAGRGLNPRPERSTHAKAGQQQTENKNQLKDSLLGNIFPIPSSSEIFIPFNNRRQNLLQFPKSRRDGRVVMQRPAKPCTPVQFRLPPPRSHLPTFKVSKPRKKNNRPPGWWNWQTQGT